MKKDVHFKLSDSSIDIIQELSQEEGITNTSALEKIIHSYNKSDNNSQMFEVFADVIVDRLSDLLKGIKFASNSSDKNSKINQLLLNQLLIYSGSTMYNNTFCNQLITASKIVEDEISSAKTKKEELKKKNIRQVKHSYVTEPKPAPQPKPKPENIDDIDLDSVDWEAMGIHPNNVP